VNDTIAIKGVQKGDLNGQMLSKLIIG